MLVRHTSPFSRITTWSDGNVAFVENVTNLTSAVMCRTRDGSWRYAGMFYSDRTTGRVRFACNTR